MYLRRPRLLVGVPGLAKTLLISTLAKTLSLWASPHPVHAGPDAQRHHRHRGDRGGPAPAQRDLRFVRGPIFANVILADEINRTPPKTQAALLEAMQEHQVTAGGGSTSWQAVLRARHAEPHRAGGHLPAARGPARPLHVQHPSRGGGAPDRQADHRGQAGRSGVRVLNGADVLRIQELVRMVPVADHVIRYALSIVRATRVGDPEVKPAGDDPQLPRVGRRTASQPVPGARRRRPRRSSRARCT
jgi:MoxR-like ATPase